MSNYRCERIFVSLQWPIPGLDHLKAIDPFQLAQLNSGVEAEMLGLTPLEDYCVAAFDGPPPNRGKPRWHRAIAGLKTARGLIAWYEKQIAEIADAEDETSLMLADKVAVLRQLEAVLDQADTRDIRFFLAMKDLPKARE